MNTRLRSLLAGAATVAAFAVPLHAQSVFQPVSVYHGSRVVAPIVQAVTPQESSISSAIDDSLPLLRAGPFALRPTLTYRLAHSSGVEFSPGLSASTNVQSISPGILLEAGNHWRVDYSPTWIHYSNPLFADSTDHWVDVRGAYVLRDWSAQIFGTYTSATPVLVELAQQAHQVAYLTGQQVDYKVGPRSRVIVNANESYRKANAVLASSGQEWHASNWRGWSVAGTFAYDLSRHTTLSALVTRGYANPSEYHSMEFTRPELQVNWTPIDTFTAGVTAGTERRRFNGQGGRHLNIPTYAAHILYRPSHTTTLSATADRGLTLSYLANTAIKTTNWNLSAEQRLLQHLFLSLAYQGQNTGYVENLPGLPTLRNDHYHRVSARIAVPVFDRGYVATYFERSQNRSSRPGYGFNNREYGVEITFKF